MMIECLSMWNEIEEVSNTKILEYYPILNFGTPDSLFLKGIFSHFPSEKVLSAIEISKLYPALKNLPESYVGMVTSESKLIHNK